MKLRSQWTLDPEIVYLNHGSFGACPAPIQRLQSELRARMEAEPVTFLVRELRAELTRARLALAELVGADPAGLVFVTNATTAVNTVLSSLELARGDRLLVTNMGYGAVTNAVRHAAARAGAEVDVVELPFPVASEDELVAAFEAALSTGVRVAVFDHITSPTALVLPIDRMVAACERRGIVSVVDGAHAVGQVDLDLARTNASFYTSNCHKWLCTPKGCAFLHVREDQRARLHPLSISHAWGLPSTTPDRLLLEFDWPGTYDPTPYLCVPESIRFMSSQVVGGWRALLARNHALVCEARSLLCARLGLTPPCPESMLGAMASLILPDARGEPLMLDFMAVDPLQVELFAEHGIETWLAAYPRWPHRVLRVSAQIYNELDEYRRLADVLAKRL